MSSLVGLRWEKPGLKSWPRWPGGWGALTQARGRPLSWAGSEKDRLVDITGYQIAPRLYMAFGVAGDVMHAAGVKGAGFVVAVHPDPDAPIFAQADLGIVGDPSEAIDRLLALL